MASVFPDQPARNSRSQLLLSAAVHFAQGGLPTMDQFVERVPKPGATQPMNIVTPPVGVQRNRLTLYLSLSAILLSVASAAVSLYVFLKAGEAKMLAETEKAKVETRVQETEAEWRPKILQNQNAALESEIRVNNAREKTEATAQERNRTETRNNLAQARVNEFQDELNQKVVKPMVPYLAESAQKGARGDLLYIPPSSVIPPAPRGGSDPYGVVPGLRRPDWTTDRRGLKTDLKPIE
jgi:hypothetical protein